MAIRLADTARPNNYVDAEHQGTFPVAYAEDIWFEDGTRLSEKTFDGQSIQVDELPVAGATQLGKVYQYIGASGTYEHGCFYECVSVSGQFSWKELRVIKNAVVNTDTEPTVGDYASGSVIVYSGEDTYGYKKGHHYKYVKNESHTLYLFSGYNPDTQVTAYLRVLEEVLVEGAHIYNTIGQCTGYIVSVDRLNVSYYSIVDDEILTTILYSLASPDTFNITGYIDIGGGGSGESTTLYADNPIGSIIPYGGANAPNGWLICNGQAVSRTTYADLFDAIGTTFGSGDGSTTFNLPDLREATTKGVGLSGKSANHYDSDGIALGEFVGDRLKNHKHTYSGSTGGISGDNWAGMGPVGFTVGDMNAFGVGRANVSNGMGIWKAEGTSKKIVEGYAVNIDLAHTHAYSGTTDDKGYDTNEVKAVGVNYIIKASHTPVPADFSDAVDEAIAEELHYNARVNTNIRAFLTSTQVHTFTATKTGFLKAYMHKSGSGYTARLFVNGVSVDQLSCFGEDSSGTILPWIANGGIDMTLSAFVKEGDVVKIDSDESGSASTNSWYIYATVLQYKA